MKKSVCAGILLLSIVSLTFAAGQKESSGPDRSLSTIQSRGQMVLGLDDAFPPMGYRNEDNKIVGYDIDLATEVAKRMGVELVLQPIDWNAKEQELNTGKIDCIWNGFTITDDREKVMAFTAPYLRNSQVLVVKGDSPYRSMADLSGRTVGLQAGSSAADALDSAASFKSSLKGVVEFKDNLTATMDLEIGGVDAVLMDSVVANFNIKQSGKDFRVLGDSLAAENYGVGFRKNDVALRNEVQKQLEAMAADGTMADITTRWFGSDISVVGK
ncbi:amino acid ABC transporter substrate-binding protein [Salinispira pacifica]